MLHTRVLMNYVLGKNHSIENINGQKEVTMEYRVKLKMVRFIVLLFDIIITIGGVG